MFIGDSDDVSRGVLGVLRDGLRAPLHQPHQSQFPRQSADGQCDQQASRELHQANVRDETQVDGDRHGYG